MDQHVDMISATEMSIVDLFTKLIFGQAEELSEQELSIVQALQIADDNISMDNYQEMGVYLRALGVQEMIGLVSRVKSSVALGDLMMPPLSGSPSTLKHR